MKNESIEEKKPSHAGRVVYTGSTYTTGGRDGGSSRSSDGKLDIQFSTPGTNGMGTNPEQLFAAGWSACFIGALKVAAAKAHVAFPANPAVNAEVDLILSDEGYSLKARLHVHLPGMDEEMARTLTNNAHQICPYSKATQGNIEVNFTIDTAI
ncbi:organic hydroperoxide resistance protein [Chryseosolibacter indicus]|uniref:Organic hydroperoxide resistance protein n=1 Tax=Chryseosolibacter indicus TaxID=2782351 RepID=A0ABS5VYC5_9BACT|nr:organic hydroperoxide resistance protein [Chryseosolibacter indicus]MBT1706241.1 organic hydroperoxide resistance protein [Chryseosolibacter indicus]